MRLLTVTCDDAGLAAGINRAIVRLYEQNYVTTASLLTNYPHFEPMGAMIASTPIAHGIHFNLTEGQALAVQNSRSGLVDAEGNFRGLANLLRLALFPPQKFLDDARRELHAQLEAYLAVGLHPTHMTTHQHFHVLPSLQALIEELYMQQPVSWVRTPDLRRAVIPLRLADVMRKRAVEHSPGVPYLDHVIDLNTWRITSTPNALAQAILRLQGTVELVVHPSEAVDPTYPANLSSPPEVRHQQALFLKQVIGLLRQYDPDLVFADRSTLGE